MTFAEDLRGMGVTWRGAEGVDSDSAGLRWVLLMLQYIASVQEIGPLLYSGCDFSGWQNFWKIIKIVATRCHILKL